MKGIMFSLELIPKIMDGSKTQTRRAEKCLAEVNKAPDNYSLVEMEKTTPEGWQTLGHSGLWTDDGDYGYKIIKPRYKASETVYLKEVWKGYNSMGGIIYKADGDMHTGLPWKSPLFLPEKYARTFLKIKNVRIERIQNIDYSGARAEGILSFDSEHLDPENGGCGYNRGKAGLPMRYNSTTAFMDL